ncbi:MAG: dihydrofolate reductase [Rhodobacteraceae bacterium]|nr:dihydrofolate reductase [Paracoccaceae bacterium]
MSLPEIVLIAAVARNGVIGADNDMPWRLPSDLKHFKAKTVGRPVLMGRKTFDSIGRPLPGRPHVVISRDPKYSPDGVETVSSLELALERGRVLAGEAGVDEVIVMGGGQIYRQAMAIADRLEITEVQLEPRGDTSFPDIDEAVFEEVAREPGVRTDKDSADFEFVTYRRRP